jgi:hypothetical protein
MIGTFYVFLQRLRPVTPSKRRHSNGNRPVYKANGMISYLITLAFLVIVCVHRRL